MFVEHQSTSGTKIVWNVWPGKSITAHFSTNDFTA